jgi:hypothetical protein
MPPRRNQRAPRPRRVLILQLDSDKLRTDGLDMVELATFVGLATKLLGAGSAEIVEATTERHLLDELARLSREGQCFDVVVAIGHSNETGIRISSDRFSDWEAFAGYLRPFEPRRLMLVACRAGRWPAANTLFTKLPKLRRIYATPVNASKDLASLMVAMVPYLFSVKAPQGHSMMAIRVGAAVLTGGQLREWVRARDHHDIAGVALDVAAQAVDPYFRSVPIILKHLLR